MGSEQLKFCAAVLKQAVLSLHCVSPQDTRWRARRRRRSPPSWSRPYLWVRTWLPTPPTMATPPSLWRLATLTDTVFSRAAVSEEERPQDALMLFSNFLKVQHEIWLARYRYQRSVKPKQKESNAPSRWGPNSPELGGLSLAGSRGQKTSQTRQHLLLSPRVALCSPASWNPNHGRGFHGFVID